MRLTGGSFRGRTIAAPDNAATRPTTDRVREALFDIILHHDWGVEIGDPLTDGQVLDAFAGSGALGFDALSRGAKHATFFEKDRKAAAAIRANIAALELEKSASLLPMDVLRPSRADAPCSLVFLDPPYRKGLVPLALDALFRAHWIASRALIVAEIAKDETPPEPEGWRSLLSRQYGDTVLLFLTEDGAASR